MTITHLDSNHRIVSDFQAISGKDSFHKIDFQGEKYEKFECIFYLKRTYFG